MTKDELEQAEMCELVQEWRDQQHVNNNLDGLRKLAKVLGYREQPYRDGDIILEFFRDNEGAIEAIFDWVGNLHISDWEESFRDEIVPTCEDEDIEKTLAEVAEMVGGNLRTDYSGRGMFGSTCFGIDCESSTECIETAAQFGIKGAKVDKMGKGWIVYWPHLKKIENEEILG